MTVLYSSTEIHAAIQEVLSPVASGRRVVLVAYVGDTAVELLPSPRGLELVCSLVPGSTSALGLSRLRQRGAQLRQSSRLHMKVYWSEQNGSVIGSANLSTNGLADGGLLEAGVQLPPGHVDIDRLLQLARPLPISTEDLDDLARQSDLLFSRGALSHSRARFISFTEWRSLPWWKPKWKIGWWTEDAALAESAMDRLQRDYGMVNAAYHMTVTENQARAGDWFLCFRLPSVTSVRWMFVDFVVPVDPTDSDVYDMEYPFQAVQVKDLKKCPKPPFRIDQEFKAALREATKSFGPERLKLELTLEPHDEWLAILGDHLHAV